jgi:hypothetical protein
MAGIRRDAPNPLEMRTATLTVLRALLAPIPDDFPGLGDRTLLLVGFAGALRRSEPGAALGVPSRPRIGATAITAQAVVRACPGRRGRE